MRISDWSSDVCSSDLAVAYRQLAACDVFCARLLAAAFGRARKAPVEFARQLLVVGGVVGERLPAGIQVGTKDGHGGPGRAGKAKGKPASRSRTAPGNTKNRDSERIV